MRAILFGAHRSRSQNSCSFINRKHIEIYGRPVKSYFDVDMQNPDSDKSLFSPIDVRLGLNLLTRITDACQVSLQGEYLRRPVGSNQTDINGHTFSRKITSFDREFANYSLGTKYNLYRGKKALLYSAFGRDQVV